MLRLFIEVKRDRAAGLVSILLASRAKLDIPQMLVGLFHLLLNLAQLGTDTVALDFRPHIVNRFLQPLQFYVVHHRGNQEQEKKELCPRESLQSVHCTLRPEKNLG
jgi:hypothetical protein